MVLICLSCRDKAPGQRECDEAIDVLNRCMREVDQASLAAISQQLAPREGISQEVSGKLAPGGSILPWNPSAFTKGLCSPLCILSERPKSTQPSVGQNSLASSCVSLLPVWFSGAERGCLVRLPLHPDLI